MNLGSAAERVVVAAVLCGLVSGTPAAFAGEPGTGAATAPSTEASAGADPGTLSADETAKQLANPNTALASLNLKSQLTHWDGSLPGAGGLESGTLLFQPSFPFPVNATDKVFFRPAIPLLVEQPVVDGSGNVHTKSGLGDVGFDLAYGRTTPTGFLLVAGVVGGLPVGTGSLSSDTWTLGPEVFVGKLTAASVVGVLPNHQWRVSGPRNVSLTTIQPILSFLPGGGWAFNSSPLITYNWSAHQWTVPLNLAVSRTVIFGRLPVKLALDLSYYLERPAALGQQWMVGFNVTPVVPNVVASWLSGT